MVEDNSFDEKIEILKTWIKSSNNIIFLGGAGVSTESGIPDFRGDNGLYKQKRDIPVETILSHDFLFSHPKEFYEFFRQFNKNSEVKPNITHYRLAELEKEGKVKAIITQNIDNLHQLAGSKNVYQLHGNAHRYYCVKCHKKYSYEDIMSQDGVPYCSCGGFIRPDVVMYGESLSNFLLREAIYLISSCDMLIVGGTSLTVYPAASLVDFYQGDKLVLINAQATPYDHRANLLIKDSLGKVFSKI